MEIIIKNAIIISNGVKSSVENEIYIVDGKIKSIAPSLNIDKEVDKIIDAKGKKVMAGFIDIGCKLFRNGYESSLNILKLTQAGTKGGFTTLTTSSLTKPIVDDKTIVEYIYSKVKSNENINLLPFGNITKGGKGQEISEIGEMIKTGAVAISDGGSSILDDTLLRDIFLYSKMLDVTIITTSICSTLIKNGVVHYGYMATKLGLEGIPRESEEIEISKKIILAKYTKARIHIDFITTKGSVELVKRAKEDGVNITCGTAPHYFSLTDTNVDNYNTFAKVFPPLRENSDVLAILNGLKDGTIDVVSSGHSPVLKDQKLCEFERAGFGISGLDVAFAITNKVLVKDNNFTLEDISLFMSKNPAKILGLKNKGQVKEGYDADLIILDENYKYKINSSKFLSRAKYSPYDDTYAYGNIYVAIVNGNILLNEE